MRNLFLTSLFILISLSVWAQLPIEQYEIFLSEQKPQEQSQLEIVYEDELKENELPADIIKSTRETYQDYKFVKAFRGSDGSYKILKVKKEEKIAVYYSAAGEFFKIEEGREDENINDDWR